MAKNKNNNQMKNKNQQQATNNTQNQGNMGGQQNCSNKTDGGEGCGC